MMSGNLAYLDPIPGEVWRTVPDYPNYDVSDHGRVRSWCRLNQKHGEPKISAIRAHIETHGPSKLTSWAQPNILKPFSSPTTPGYYAKMTMVRNEDGEKHFMIARLVHILFIGPVPDEMDIKHLDGDENNDCATNLGLQPSFRMDGAKEDPALREVIHFMRKQG